MSLRVFAWDSNPTIDPFLYRQSNNRAQELVDEGRGLFIVLVDGRRAVQLIASREEKAEKSVGASNLIPFGRVYNKMMAPPSINYEIPHAGDLGLRRHIRKFIRVSTRKIDLAALYLKEFGEEPGAHLADAFPVPTRVLPHSNPLASSAASLA